MNCKFHLDKKGTNTCNICGDWICGDCVIDINQRIYCKTCLKNQLDNQEARISSSKGSSDRKPSDFLTLIFSVIPGCGQMYLGYTKRGLLLLILFATFMNGSYPLAIFGFITVIFSFFDTFKIKRNLQRNIYVEDNIKDLVKFAKENIIILSIVAALLIIPNISRDLRHLVSNIFSFDMFYSFKSGILLCLVIFFIFLIIKKCKNKKKKDINNLDDTFSNTK